MQVKAIKDGTVIDHIPSDKLFQVVGMLQLDSITDEVTVGNNLDSKILGKKGIIKISNHYFKDSEINQIALLTPKAKINIIRDYQVVEKKVIELPDEICGLVHCANPKCISNNEPMTPKYVVTNREPLTLKCRYCEREMLASELKLI